MAVQDPTKPFEISKPGKHRSMSGEAVAFTEEMMKASVAAYDPALHEAPFVKGHPRHDDPAFGWVAGLSYDNDRISVAPHQVEAAFAEDVKAGRVKKVSACWYKPDNIFQRKLDHLDKGFDQLSFDIRRAMREQDGSEVKSVELEKLEIRAKATSEARTCFETLRDQAADIFAVHTGQPWMPSRGSRTSTSAMTAAVIDSREFLAATERKKTLAKAPEGPTVVVAGGMEFNDHKAIFTALDKVHKKHPQMVLVHGGAPKGTDLIAAKWAAAKKVDQVVFKPDWNKYGKSRAGFKRNDAMLELLPIGVLAFPGTGITENLVDKARSMGIPTKKYA